MPIQDLIAAKQDVLTPTERRIARVVLDDPTCLAFGTVADLARQAETSGPSVVRFASKLGFEGYSKLQGWVREHVSQQLATPSQRIRHHDPRPAVRRSVEQAVEDTFESLDQYRLAAVTSPLARANRIWILSGETSMAGAHALVSGLSMLRPGVHLVVEHSIGCDLCGAAEGDAAVVFDFARYRRVPLLAAQALVDVGADLVAITDGPLSPLASLTQLRCDVRVPAIGPFDSSVPAVLVAELIVAHVAEHLGDACRQRIDRLERVWRETETYVDDTKHA